MPKAPVSALPDTRTGTEKRRDTLANKKLQEQAQLRQESSSEKGDIKHIYSEHIRFL
jgi:hypothetical protein